MKKMILKNIRITEKQNEFLKSMAATNEEAITILIRKIINFYMANIDKINEQSIQA